MQVPEAPSRFASEDALRPPTATRTKRKTYSQEWRLPCIAEIHLHRYELVGYGVVLADTAHL